MNNIHIRAATAADASAVADMIQRLAEQTGAPTIPLTTEQDVLEHGPGSTGNFDGIIAEIDGTITGMCLFSVTFSGWRGSPGLFVSDLFVAKEARSRGLGRQLLAAAADRGRKRGCTYMRLDVAPENRAAISFYRKLGFTDHDSERPMFLEIDGIEALCKHIGEASIR